MLAAFGKIRKSLDYEESSISVKCWRGDAKDGTSEVPEGTRWVWFVRAADVRIMGYRDEQFRIIGDPVVYKTH